MEKRLLSVIADFTRKIYLDIKKDPHESSDAHMAKCYIEAFISVMSKEGKDIIIIDRTTGNSESLTKV